MILSASYADWAGTRFNDKSCCKSKNKILSGNLFDSLSNGRYESGHGEPPDGYACSAHQVIEQMIAGHL